MDIMKLIEEAEKAGRLASGLKSRVVVLVEGNHYELDVIAALGDTIVLVAGEEAEAPIDPTQHEADKIDEAMEGYDPGSHYTDDPRHLRTAEDQPGQP